MLPSLTILEFPIALEALYKRSWTGPTILHRLGNVIITKYSQLSLSRIPRDPLKYFEISVPRHIRFAELRKNNLNNHITNIYVIELLKLEIY